jgi:hypothetical protein
MKAWISSRVSTPSLLASIALKIFSLQRDGSVTVTIHNSEEHPHHHARMHAAWTHHTSSAHHHPSSAHHAHSLARVWVVQLVLLLLLWALRLLHHRALLGTRNDSAARQNESRRREHQNALLHFNLLGDAPHPFNPAYGY